VTTDLGAISVMSCVLAHWSRSWIISQAGLCVLLDGGRAPSAPEWDSHAVSGSDIRKMFRRAYSAAKLTGIWFHDLRRSFVTNARRRGVPESVVMKMSGHRTRAVFDRYNIIEEDDLREAVNRLEAGAPKRNGISGQDLDKVAGKESRRTKASPANSQ
jgi:integrase